MPENELLHRSGFVSILGRPNAGKSTLLNTIAGEKLAIISDKPQTTRVAVQAVVTRPDAQIVFADTPGILRSAIPPACYCRCSQSHARAGCSRMCETRKRTARSSAATCAKPRIKLPSENPGAGPRFARSDRAERASR